MLRSTFLDAHNDAQYVGWSTIIYQTPWRPQFLPLLAKMAYTSSVNVFILVDGDSQNDTVAVRVFVFGDDKKVHHFLSDPHTIARLMNCIERWQSEGSARVPALGSGLGFRTPRQCPANSPAISPHSVLFLSDRDLNQ